MVPLLHLFRRSLLQVYVPPLSSLEVSPDGRYVLYVQDDSTNLMVHEANNLAKPLRKHSGVRMFQITDDGRSIVAYNVRSQRDYSRGPRAFTTYDLVSGKRIRNVSAKKLKVKDDLAEFKGVPSDVLLQLANNGIKSLDDLADLSRDEFVDLLPESGLKDRQIDDLIMNARSHWFEEDKESEGDEEAAPKAKKSKKSKEEAVEVEGKSSKVKEDKPKAKKKAAVKEKKTTKKKEPKKEPKK